MKRLALAIGVFVLFSTPSIAQSWHEEINPLIQLVRTNCLNGYHIGNDGKCRRLTDSTGCGSGYFLDYDGRCKKTRKNLRLEE